MNSKLLHKCPECNDVFNNKFSFFEHKNIHSGEKPFMCLNCKESFSLVREYANHILIKHNQVPKSGNEKISVNSDDTIECSSLRKEISSKKTIFESQKDNKLQCEKCQESFENSINFESHSCVENFDNKLNEEVLQQCDCCSCQLGRASNESQNNVKNLPSFECQNCSKNFTSGEEFTKHINICLKCSCFQVFSSLSDFKAHLKGEPYNCCSCSMQFNLIHNLIKHIRTHTKQKPYVCKVCGRGFTQPAQLRNHISVHLAVKAIKCNQCDFSCKTLGGLIKHRKRHKEGFFDNLNYIDKRKISTGTFTCPICNKLFLFKRNLGKHMNIHKKSKVCLCSVCGKVFDSQNKQKKHFKSCHKDPSTCYICGTAFSSAVLLKFHMRTHAPEKRFTCNLCFKKFVFKNSLVAHVKSHIEPKQISCTKCGKLFRVAASLKYHSKICPSLKISV